MLSSVDLVVSNMKTYTPGDTETITGTGLTSAVNVVFVGPVTKSIVATLNTNTITYTIPELP
jgi:predicted ATP-dependent Lon-type protease